MTLEWFKHFLNNNIVNQPLVCSDHAVIVLDTEDGVRKKIRPYQIENWCLQYPIIIEMIINNWAM